MKQKTEIAWGILTSNILVYPTIQTTRKNAIERALRSRGIHEKMTLKEFLSKFPYCKVIKVQITYPI